MTEKKKVIKQQENACLVAKKCGGCNPGVPYEKQLLKKQRKVKELMQDFCKVKPIIGMEHPYHYRNKVHAVFDRLKNGTIVSGIYKEGTHTVINVDSCLIEDKIADAIIEENIIPVTELYFPFLFVTINNNLMRNSECVMRN